MLQYLHQAVRFLQPGADQATAIVAVLVGRAAYDANRLDAEPVDRHPDAEHRKKIAKTVGYLRNKDSYLGYDTALVGGWPIPWAS